MSAVAMMPPPFGGGDDDVGGSDWGPLRIGLREAVQLATCLGVWAIFLALLVWAIG